MSRQSLSGLFALKLIGFYAVLFLLILLNLINFPFLGKDGGTLSFLMIGLYFWTVYRPTLIPYYLVFFVGLLLDLLSGGLVGLHTLSFMMMVMIVRGQRKFLLGQSWSVVWVGYCVASTVVACVHYLFYCMASMTILPLAPLGFSLLVCYFLYPLLLPLMMLLNRLMYD